MKAWQLIEPASFGPEAMKAISEAFDAAWKEIAANYGNDAEDVSKARERLAHAILAVAYEDSRDVAVLKEAALQIMALDYEKSRS